MAKKKQTEEVTSVTGQAGTLEVNVQTENIGDTEAEKSQPENVTQVEDPTNVEHPQESGDDAQSVTDVQAPVQAPISDNILAYLKRHPEEEAVYIDKLGGVFSTKTPQAFLKDAVLYQNPFFKQ